MSEIDNNNSYFNDSFGEEANRDEWHSTVLGRKDELSGQRFFREIDTDQSNSISQQEFNIAVEAGVLIETDDGYKVNSDLDATDSEAVKELLEMVDIVSPDDLDPTKPESEPDSPDDTESGSETGGTTETDKPQEPNKPEETDKPEEADRPEPEEEPVTAPPSEPSAPSVPSGPSGKNDGVISIVNFNTQRSAMFLDDAKGDAFVETIQGMEHKPDVFAFQEFAYDKNRQQWTNTGTGKDVNSIEDDVLPLIRESLGLGENAPLYHYANFEGLLTVSTSPLEASGTISGSHGRMDYALTNVEGKDTLIVNVHFGPTADKVKRSNEINQFLADVENGKHRDKGLDPDSVDTIIFAGDVNFHTSKEPNSDNTLHGRFFDSDVDVGLDRISSSDNLQLMDGGQIKPSMRISDHPMLYAAYKA